MNSNFEKSCSIRQRFDGFLPIVIDLETGGCNPEKDALLELAAIVIHMDTNGQLVPSTSFSTHIMPFEGANLDPKSMQVNRIDPYHPFRFAISEKEALEEFFKLVEVELQNARCRRAVLVGHNAHFDLSFLHASCKRNKFNKSPFHSFTCFDTATLGGIVYGKTVLAKILAAANIPFDEEQAHSAVYDCEVTAAVFCKMINEFHAKS